MKQAIENGDLETVSGFVNKGNYTNYSIEHPIIDESDESYKNFSPLHYAIKCNQMGLVDYFIDECDAAHQETDAYNRMAAHVAAEYNRSDAIKKLAINGATMDAPDMSSMTPLMAAIHYNCVEAAEALLELHDDGYDIGINAIQQSSGFTVLHWAVHQARTGLVQKLIDAGADTEIKTIYEKDTPVMLAAKNNSSDAIIMLAKNGARLNAINKEHRTPLMIALAERSEAAAETLLQFQHDGHDIGINAIDSMGCSALRYLIRPNPNTDLIHKLIDAGADKEKLVMHRGNKMTVLGIACALNNKKLVHAMLAYGANYKILDMDSSENSQFQEEINKAKQADTLYEKGDLTLIDTTGSNLDIARFQYRCRTEGVPICFSKTKGNTRFAAQKELAIIWITEVKKDTSEKIDAIDIILAEMLHKTAPAQFPSMVPYETLISNRNNNYLQDHDAAVTLESYNNASSSFHFMIDSRNRNKMISMFCSDRVIADKLFKTLEDIVLDHRDHRNFHALKNAYQEIPEVIKNTLSMQAAAISFHQQKVFQLENQIGKLTAQSDKTFSIKRSQSDSFTRYATHLSNTRTV